MTGQIPIVGTVDNRRAVIARGSLLDQRRASASVYSLNSKRIAALITSEAEPGSGCVEIYALSVVKKYQNQGYGSLILNDLINHYPHTDSTHGPADHLP